MTIHFYARKMRERKYRYEVRELKNGKFGVYNLTLGTFKMKHIDERLEFSTREKAEQYIAEQENGNG